MILANTPDRYGAVHKTLHWVIALLVLMMLVMGLVMGGIANPADRFWVYSLHKSIGITVLTLMVVRLGWKLINWHKPAPLPTHPWYERLAAELVHWGFYGLLIAMPLSGWILTSAANSTINWFGFFVVPSITEPDQTLRELMSEVHEYISYAIWAFIALHVAGALKHVIIDRDGTLRRMLPFTAPVLLLFMAAPAMSAEWTIDREQSRLFFEATQEGAPFKGQFKAFDGKITFDEKNLAGSKATIIIDLGSIDTKNAERDSTVKTPEWFDVATTPSSAYNIKKFEKGEKDGEYIAKGFLTLRGLERPLDLPFTFTATEKDNGTTVAMVDGSVMLDRLEFNVGNGQWADPAMVGKDIKISIHIVAVTKGK